MKKIRIIFLILCILILLLFAGFSIWALTPPAAGAIAEKSLQGNSIYQVEKKRFWYHFEPSQSSRSAVIFYPGGRVNPAAYAPLASELASAGYQTFILRCPFNMAIFSTGRADKVLSQFTDYKVLALGGHSLGGVAAASYWENSWIEGLFLLSSYPVDVLAKPEPVLALYGSNDGLLDDAERQYIRQRLPGQSTIIEIEGGNHAQMGDYGFQKNDGTAAISLEEQQKQVTEEILNYLSKLD